MRTGARSSTPTIISVLCGLLAAAMLLAPAAMVQQQGGNYTLYPTVTAGGGGTSSNGATSLSGTIGQNALGVSSGGAFTLNAGFWQAEAPCALPQITAQPLSQSACEGASVTFSVTVSDAGVTYQWRRDGVSINSATSPTLTLNSVSVADAAAYTVVVAKPCGVIVTSDPAMLTVATYMLAPTGASLPASGGGGNFNVIVAGTCPWIAVSNDPWITITGSESGAGNGVVSYSVTANPGGGRTGTITAAGKVFTVSQQAPTAITLISFAATAYNEGILLDWQTGFEADNLGFNLYREEGGKRQAVNAQLVAGSALTTEAALLAGRHYAWWDAAPGSPSTAYWLEDVDLDGQATWHGPFYVKQATGKPPASSQAALLASLGRTAGADRTRAVEPQAAMPSPKGLIQPINLAALPAIKIEVRQSGYYRLSQAELLAAGLSPAVDPRSLRLFVDGRELPIRVSGESDGKFDTNDTVEFYGVGLNVAATATRAYWLVAGAQTGMRIAKASEAAGRPVNDRFAAIIERRDRALYFSSLRNGEAENFFGAVVTASPIEQAMTVRAMAEEAETEAVLEVALQGVTRTTHRVMVSLNGNVAGYVDFTGQERGVDKVAVPHSLLREGDNQVRLQALNGGSDVSLVDFIRITYQRAYRAEADVLRCTAQGGTAVTVAGFTNQRIRIIDVTDPDSPQELTGDIEEEKGPPATGYLIKVTAPGAGVRQLLAFSDDRVWRAAGVKANRPSGWKRSSNAADFVIIAHERLAASLKPLADWREKQGLKTALIDVEDLYDEFSFGHKSPQAIKDFLNYAYTNWQQKPRYVLMAGDASFDPKNYLGFGDTDLVPTKLIDTAYLETASDEWLADFDGDDLAEMAVGRLPARTGQEAEVMVSKLIAYDQSPPAEAALLVADQNDGYDFEQASAALVPLVPNALQVARINRGQLDAGTARQQLFAEARRRQTVINYAGHGSTNEWRGGLLTSADAEGLGNESHLPLFVMMSCLTGYFLEPSADGLGEALLKAERGGAVAVFASSGMTLPGGQVEVNLELYRRLFAGGATLGEAIRAAKAATADADVRRTYVLLGDPALRLK